MSKKKATPMSHGASRQPFTNVRANLGVPGGRVSAFYARRPTPKVRKAKPAPMHREAKKWLRAYNELKTEMAVTEAQAVEMTKRAQAGEAKAAALSKEVQTLRKEVTELRALVEVRDARIDRLVTVAQVSEEIEEDDGASVGIVETLRRMQAQLDALTAGEDE